MNLEKMLDESKNIYFNSRMIRSQNPQTTNQSETNKRKATRSGKRMTGKWLTDLTHGSLSLTIRSTLFRWCKQATFSRIVLVSNAWICFGGISQGFRHKKNHEASIYNGSQHTAEENIVYSYLEGHQCPLTMPNLEQTTSRQRR